MTPESNSFKANVIFIDDEYHVLKTIQRLCKRIEANCHYFNDSKSALEWAQNNPVHIAVSDMNMPNKNGLDVLGEIAHLYPESILVLMTGYAHENLLRDAINKVHLWHLIDKPWNNSQFIGVIQSALEQYFAVRDSANEGFSELSEQVEIGQSTERMKQEFLAMMGHEIRTPMTNVIGALNLLQETELNKEQATLTRHALEAGNSMLSLLSDIITYSKFESGFQSISVHQVVIDEGLQNTIEQYRIRAIEKGLEFEFTIEPNLNCKIFTDIKIIRQVVSNLLDNAIKFTHSGRIITHISYDSENLLKISVKDTGIGIPEDTETNIFSRFTQINYSYNREYEGTGLGLTVCKLLAEKLGGEVGFSSRIGEGSEFWFTVVDHQSAFDDHDTSTKKELLQLQSPVENYTPTKEELEALKNKEILLVEDSSANQLIISSMLQSTGIAITLAKDGIEAIERMEQQNYDLILMDLSMPRMDGAEAARHIRDELKQVNIPIIALTANSELYDIKHCLASGMTDYAFKPIEKTYLVNCIAYYLSNRSSPDITSAAPGIEESGEEYLNPQAIKQLIADTSPEMMQKITGLYFQEMKKRGETIRLNRQDYTVIAKEAHAIKSSSATIGASLTAELAKQLDHFCKQEQFEQVAPLIDKLLVSLNKTESSFEHYVASL